jgi:tetratricopeptide (TPR) repeat protein
MNTLRHIILLLTTALLVQVSYAQSEDMVEANRKYQAGDLAGARILLDAVVKKQENAKSPEAWVLRGFVYKDLFKAELPGTNADLLRDEALSSLFTSTVVDTAREYVQSSTQAYEFLCKTLFNDAARALNDMDDGRAIALYAKYKQCVLRLNPEADLKARDIEFNNALGTVYTKNFNRDRENMVWFDKAVELYRRVLETDSNNYGANYNLATLYYNRGVYNIQHINAGTEIPDIQAIQDASKEFFTAALPYMKKAHTMNPKRKETLLGLEGIHYSLQDVQESEHYRFLYEQLDQESPGQQDQPRDK